MINSLKSPVLGVFLPKNSINKIINREKNFKSKFIVEELVKASERAGVNSYFFALKHIDYKSNTIIGTYYDQSQKMWAQKRFSFPDVLYDRFSGPGKNKNDIRKLHKRLDKSGIKKISPFINYNKWEVTKKLGNYPQLNQHLPETVLLKNKRQLYNFLNENRTIYVKDCYSSLGKKVMRIEKADSNNYKYSYYKEFLVSGIAENFNLLYKTVSTFFKGKRIIAQEAIDLLEFEESLVDIRGELQRNGRGKLEVTGIAVRVGSDNSPITTHAFSYPFKQFFETRMFYSSKQVRELHKRINSFMLNIYHRLEESYGQFGEMGIDVGLDKEGKLWLIECNLRPMKISLYKAFPRKTLHRSFLNLLKYAKYLTS